MNRIHFKYFQAFCFLIYLPLMLYPSIWPKTLVSHHFDTLFDAVAIFKYFFNIFQIYQHQ